MAASRIAETLVVVLAIVVTAAQRPTHAEYKAQKDAESASAATTAAKDAKMGAVNKVISMLEDLQKQVLNEGEAEAKTYNTFACWAKTTQKEKQEAITSGKDDKASLSATIAKLSSTRKELDTAISEHEKDISDAEKAMKSATADSNAAFKEYETNKADLSAALASLNGAINELKTSKKPSLLQMQGISKTISQAVIMADALGLNTPTSSMLQEADVPMENYKFHSSSIIETLENLLGEFREEKNKVDADEVSRVKSHQMLMQEKKDLVEAKTSALQSRQKARSKAEADISSNSQELSTTSATLLDDLEYLSEVNTISSQKAKTWDQRSKVRADELSALTAAIGIIKGTVAEKTEGSTMRFAQLGVSVRMADVVATSDSAMEAIEQSAEEAEGDSSVTGFLLQRRVSRHDSTPPAKVLEGRQKIVELLKNKGKQLKSTLLSSLAVEVAGQGSADVFGKIKTLIQELIQRLLTEAANEATHQGWCTKAIHDATQKRNHASEDIATLNADLAVEEAKLDKFTENLSVLKQEIEQLKAGRVDAEKIRAEEKAENKNTVTEAQAGLSAVQDAIKILTQFYATAAKSTVDLSLAQTHGPSADMPDAGFEAGEAYTGAGGEAGGVVGMLEVIEGDFVRTMKETEKAEVHGEEDHLAFMTESGKSLAEKETATSQNTKYKDSTEAKLEKDGESLRAKSTILKMSIAELLELQPACVDTGMSYQDRVAHREEETAALKKALCILNAYASYGPDALAGAC